MKKLSIVTITYNNFEELENTLNSIPKEEYIESVVINGGSCEKTRKYLSDYEGVVINESDKGIADAFNKGIRTSSGEFIMFLNSGDILINREYLLESIKFLTDNPDYSFTHSNILYKDTLGGTLNFPPKMKSLGRGMPYNHPSMIFNKDVFSRIGLYNLDKKINMDFDLIVRMEKEGLKGYYLKTSPVVIMEGTGRSITREFEAIKECYYSLKENKDLTLNNSTGFTIRVILYFLRKVLVVLKLDKLLGFFKRMKYRSKIQPKSF